MQPSNTTSSRKTTTTTTKIRTRRRTWCPRALVIFVMSHLMVQQHQVAESWQDYSPMLSQQQQAPTQYHQHNNILHFTVFENAPIGTYVGTIRSADGQIPTLIVPSSTPENERIAALYVNTTNGDITTNSVLDRESREQYQFVAMVSNPYAEVKCSVTVKDVNDNAPMFLMPSANETTYVIEMPEGQRGTRKVLPLAVDFDSFQYGIKEFRIVSVNTPSDTFRLVDHEAPARSALQQQQQQQQQQLDESSAQSLAPGADNSQIMQQLAQQATVLIPSQPIMQSTPNHHIISGAFHGAGPGSPQQQQQANMGQAASLSPQSKYSIDLEVNQILDRENQSSYQLVVEAIDGGQPQLIGRLMVTVNVQDINDNDPVFTQKIYECQVKEDAARGAYLARVQAHDADLDANGQITYSIKRHSSSSQPNGVNNFNSNSSDNSNSNNNNEASRYLTSNSGQQQKQRNGQQSSPTSAAATTQASARQQQQQQQLAVPQQMRQQAGNEIYEQIDTSSNIPQTSNNYPKPKSPPNFTSTPEQLFEIDPIKGEIHLRHQLDYETDRTHELLIEACDHGKPPRTAYATVKVVVLDVNDDPPPSLKVASDENKGKQSGGGYQHSLATGASSEPSRSAELMSNGRLTGGGGGDFLLGEAGQYPLGQLAAYLATWFAHVSSLLVFVVVFGVVSMVGFIMCLVKTRSRQPESDYNDTTGLTMNHNNGQTKPSPNHSTSNEHHSNGSSQEAHHRHDHQRITGSYAGLNGLDTSGYAPPNGSLRYQSYHHDSASNHYHNLYHNLTPRQHQHQQPPPPPDSPSPHQMATSHGGSGGGGGGIVGLGSGLMGCGSAGGTMTLHNHPGLFGTPGGHHHSLEHHHHSHHHQYPTGHHSSSLTYGHHHSRAALLQQHVHHHQSSHHLSSAVHHAAAAAAAAAAANHNKGGTMNSIGTHHSAHPSASPETPNTTHSSGLPPNHLPDAHHGHNNNGTGHSRHSNNPPLPSSAGQQHQLQSPLQSAGCHATSSAFTVWPQGPGSTVGCYPGSGGGAGSGNVGPMRGISGSTIDCTAAGTVVTPAPPTGSSQAAQDSAGGGGRFFDFGGSSAELAYAQDWCGSYNWDYLSNWVPEYQSIMTLLPHSEA